MTDLSFRSAKQLATLIKRKQVSSQELLEMYIKRMEAFNSKVNAIVTTDLKAAKKRAAKADEALAKGKNWGPLHGVPMTIKEAFNVVGMPTTWGLKEYRKNLPKTNALAVQRLLDAGAILFGKTNVPVQLSDWQTFNPVYGTTNNPWDLKRGPGGSSGGAAAALAAGLTGLEIGSDIGASIRNPSHYCGVYGHKPTYGIATMKGHQLPETVQIDSLDIAVIGPMARSAADLSLALNIIAGPDEIHSRGWQLRLPRPSKRHLKEYKVGILYNDAEAEVDHTIQTQLQNLTKFLKSHGVTVGVGKKPKIDSKEAHQVYIRLLRTATSSAMTDKQFKKVLKTLPKLKNKNKDYPAQMMRAQATYHRDWLAFNEIRHQMRYAWEDYFEKYDLLLCPAATTPAFPHNHKGERWERMLEVNGKPQPSTTPLFWAGYSGHVFLPSTVAPIGLTPQGLPVGVQIVGRHYADLTCIHFAQLLERAYYQFVPPPHYDKAP